MALDRTSGFDVLVQISETEINNQLATAFLAGLIIPASISAPVNSNGIVGTVDLNFLTPTADLDRPRPKMGITIPFTNSQFQITAPIPLVIAPLGGTIEIVDDIEVISEGTNEIVVMDFNNGSPNVNVTFDAASLALLNPLLAVAGLTQVQFQNITNNIVTQQLQTSIGRINLSTPIPVVDDTDPTTVFDIDVTTINDTSAADRDCIVLGIKMASDSGGNINLATTNFIPAGSETLVMFSNWWLLARVMRPRVAAALGLDVSFFDTPLRLNQNVPAPGGEGTLTRLEARIDGNRIRVDGTATDSGTGWSAVSNFTFFIDLTLSGGNINITSTTPTVDTDIDIEWWAWLISFAIMPILGPIILAIVEAVAEGIVNDMVSGGLSGAVGNLPSIPLGPIGGGIAVSSIVLDDLELRCSIMRSVTVPIKSQGFYESGSAFALDLDSGHIRSTANDDTDLKWNPASGIITHSNARLRVTGTNYYALTPVQVSRMSLTNTLIPISQIPISFPPSIPFFPHDNITFGVRTTDGRYAKVRAWRSAINPGAIDVEWITFDTPTPKLDIAARWSIAQRGEVSEYITPDCYYCKSSPVSWCGVFEAWPCLMAFPIDYQWCICGTVIADGTGEVDSKYGQLKYELSGRRLCIKSEMGKTIDCELCVSAIDAKGHELFTCIRIFKPGIDRKCRKCDPSKKYITIDQMPIASHLAEWRPLVSNAIIKMK